MPTRPKRPCRQPGCPNLCDSRYCATHQAVELDERRQAEQWRGSAHSRGYDRQWLQFRTAYLARPENALCRDCQSEGRVRIATELHHVAKLRANPELKYESTNILPLCHECHSTRTGRGE